MKHLGWVMGALLCSGCIHVGAGGDLQFDGGAAERAWHAAVDEAGLGDDMVYVGYQDGTKEFPGRASAQSFVAQHRGKKAAFAGPLMRAHRSGALDVMHSSSYTRGRRCVPNHPTATCLNPKGGIPKTVVRCVGSSLGHLKKITAGGIAGSTGYPWTRSGPWEHVTITGRVSRVTSDTTQVASGRSGPSGKSLSDFGEFGSGNIGPVTYVFSVIELTNCRLATFRRKAVSKG